MPDSELVELLHETFGTGGGLPAGCWMYEAIDANQPDFADVIRSVTRAGQRDSLRRRLAAEHPRDREHFEERDDRLFDVFTEAEAFAWAREIAALGDPRFIFQEGAPDLLVQATWVEAKALRTSDDDKRDERRAAEAWDFERTGIMMRDMRALGPLPEAAVRQLGAVFYAGKPTRAWWQIACAEEPFCANKSRA